MKCLVHGVHQRLFNFGPTRPVMRQLCPRAAILVYHRVGECSIDPAGQLVSPQRFEAQLRMLRQRYSIVSLADLVAAHRQRRYADETIAITFDDGYADNLILAQPIAAMLDVPVTFFITLEPILSGVPFWWDELARWLLGAIDPPPVLTLDVGGKWRLATSTATERLVAYQQLQPIAKRLRPELRRELLDTLAAWAAGREAYPDRVRLLTVEQVRTLSCLPQVTLGTHTLTHPMLSTLENETQQRELVTSREQLAELIGKPVTLTAYPYGKHADLGTDTSRLAQEAGYDAACTTTGEWIVPGTDPYRLPRVTVHDWSSDQLAARLSAVLNGPSRPR